jgi:fatty acid desaturase
MTRRDYSLLGSDAQHLPAPSPSIRAAFRDVLPVLARQLRYEDVFLRSDLPPTARPYREDFHRGALGVRAE